MGSRQVGSCSHSRLSSTPLLMDCRRYQVNRSCAIAAFAGDLFANRFHASICQPLRESTVVVLDHGPAGRGRFWNSKLLANLGSGPFCRAMLVAFQLHLVLLRSSMGQQARPAGQRPAGGKATQPPMAADPPISPEDEARFASQRENSPAYQEALERYLYPQHVRELAARILASALNTSGIKCTEPGIDILQLARFLAALAEAKPSYLRWLVKKGLALLQVEKRKVKRGRPRGSGAKFYGVQYKVMAEVAAPLWERKATLQSESPRRWKPKLRIELTEQGFSDTDINALINATTLRQFITVMVAANLGVEPETAERGIRRAGKVVQSVPSDKKTP
jgi:hypothetical protein